MTNKSSNQEIVGLFPTPVYIAERGSDLTAEEKLDIKKIQDGDTRMRNGGMNTSMGNTYSANNYIFDKYLKEIKQFCDYHIEKYVKEIINPKEKLDFYITQSWLNVTEANGFHHKHSHQNSIISGVFYISTVEEDKITFEDPNCQVKSASPWLKEESFNVWNSTSWFIPIENNTLILFPSYLNHQVERNQKATSNRVSVSFNCYVKGRLGAANELTELFLK